MFLLCIGFLLDVADCVTVYLDKLFMFLGYRFTTGPRPKRLRNRRVALATEIGMT